MLHIRILSDHSIPSNLDRSHKQKCVDIPIMRTPLAIASQNTSDQHNGCFLWPLALERSSKISCHWSSETRARPGINFSKMSTNDCSTFRRCQRGQPRRHASPCRTGRWLPSSNLATLATYHCEMTRFGATTYWASRAAHATLNESSQASPFCPMHQLPTKWFPPQYPMQSFPSNSETHNPYFKSENQNP